MPVLLSKLKKYPKAFDAYVEFLKKHEQGYQEGVQRDPYPIGQTQFVNVIEGKTVAHVFGQIERTEIRFEDD